MRAIFTVLLTFLAVQAVFAQEHDAVVTQQQEPLKSVHVYPNPAVEFVSIKFEQPMARTVRFTLHSIIGNAVEVESEIVDDYELRIKVKDLPAGYYLIAMKDAENGRASYKFLKR